MGSSLFGAVVDLPPPLAPPHKGEGDSIEPCETSVVATHWIGTLPLVGREREGVLT